MISEEGREEEWKVRIFLGGMRNYLIFEFSTGFQLFQRVGNPMFARLFFSSSR